jgi:hypothetical protein
LGGEFVGMARLRTNKQNATEAPAEAEATSDTTLNPPAAPRRGRPRGSTNNAAPAASTPKRTGSTRTGRPRRARTGGAAETGALLDALLKSRGAQGATQEELQRIVVWADETRRETVAIEDESRPRRAPRGSAKAAGPRTKAAQERRKREQQEREDQLRDRRTRNQTDRALLEGVLAGRVLLDVAEGSIRFLDAAAGSIAAAAHLPTGVNGNTTS